MSGERVCAHCGASMAGKLARAVYCGRKCKERAYREANREKMAAYSRAYCEANREKLIANGRERYRTSTASADMQAGLAAVPERRKVYHTMKREGLRWTT